MERDGERDEREVDADERRAAEQRVDGDCNRVLGRRSKEEQRKRGGEGGECVDGRVERRALEWLPLDDLRDERADGRHEHRLLPAEEDDGGEDEDERERDRAQVVLLEGDGLELGEERERQEEQYGEPFCPAWRIEPETHRRPDHDRSRERESARDKGAQPGRIAGGFLLGHTVPLSAGAGLAPTPAGA